MRVISDYMHGRENNYNLLRVLAALFIAYYHSYFMTLGPGFTDNKFPFLYQASQIVLNFFFIVSGFLIAQSFERRKDIISYSAARALRLLPGVFVLSLLMAFVVGPLLTEGSLVAYFSDGRSWFYVPLTTALYPDATLPGLFTSNPNPDEVDQALWTLRYEVICYIGLAVAGIIGAIQQGRLFTLLMALVFIIYGFVTYFTDLRDIDAVHHLMHFGLSFFIGLVFYVYRDAIALNFLVALGLGCLALGGFWLFGPLSEPLVIVATAYIVFWLAYVPDGFIRRYNDWGDYSYGVYIYHFPIQQIFMTFAASLGANTLFALSLPFILLAAFCSWVLVERPALQKLKPISTWLKNQIAMANGRAL